MATANLEYHQPLDRSFILCSKDDSSRLRLSMKHIILRPKLVSHFWLIIQCFILSLNLEELSYNITKLSCRILMRNLAKKNKQKRPSARLLSNANAAFLSLFCIVETTFFPTCTLLFRGAQYSGRNPTFFQSRGIPHTS